MPASELPKGFQCADCERFHDFTSWVYAHWDINLIHTCDCGRQHSIIRGRATPKRKAKERRDDE